MEVTKTAPHLCVVFTNRNLGADYDSLCVVLEKYLNSILRPEEVGTIPQILKDVSLKVEVDKNGEKKTENVTVSELLYEENAIYLLVIEDSASIDKNFIKSIIELLHPLYGIVVIKEGVISRSFDCSGKKSKKGSGKNLQRSNLSIIDIVVNKINKCRLLPPARIPNDFSVFNCDSLFVGDKVYWPIKDGKLYNPINPIEFKRNSLFQFTSIERVKTILENTEDSMTSLIAMNDKSEYSRWDPVSNWNNIDISVDKEVFIKSLCKEKSLDMWRLYGNDAKGACIEYECARNMPQGYVLNPVCYNTESLHAFDAFSKLFKRFQIIPDGPLFRHFLKMDHYKIENEVRLLYKKRDEGVSYYNSGVCKVVPVLKIKQTSFPLKIKKIWLGWLCPYKDRNIVSIGLLAPNLDIEIEHAFEDYVGN